MKKILTAALTLVFMFAVCITGCGQTQTPSESGTGAQNGEKLKVMVSIYPIKEFAEQIGGDKVEVSSMVPDNVEPHDYEPKTKDFGNLTESDMFIYNGLGIESWTGKVNEMIDQNKTTVVDTSKNVNVNEIDGQTDPHCWLSLKEASKQAETIKDALAEKDPANKDYYEANYESFSKELDTLYNEYKEKFEGTKNKDFITGHAAFGYLCRDFGLKQQSVSNLFGEGEPTPKQLEDLVKFCKENNIKTIFSESLASPKVSETLAKEVGAEVVPILTLESNEDDKSYIEAMKYNLEKIYDCLNA